MTLDELKEQHPDAFNLLVTTAKLDAEADVKETLDNADAKVTELEEKVSDAEKTNAELSAKVDEFEAKQALTEFKVKLDKYLSENLSEKALTEGFATICEKLGSDNWDTIESMTQERKASFDASTTISEGDRKVVDDKTSNDDKPADSFETIKTNWQTASTTG